MASKHLQSAYTGLKNSLQQEWAFVQWFTSDIGDAFVPISHFLNIKEVVTQGDPLAMISYGIGVLPLI